MEDTITQTSEMNEATEPSAYVPPHPPRKRNSKKNKRTRLLQRRLIAFGGAAAIFLAIFGMGAAWGGGRGPKITNETVQAQLKGLGELSTTNYHFTNVERFENIEDFYGWDASDYSNFTLSYTGVVSASVDPAQAKVEVSGKKITVTLPEAKITAEEIKQDSISFYNTKQGAFEAIALTDFAGFKENQKTVIEARATADGLLFNTSDKAKIGVKQLVESLTGGSEKYDIAVK